MSETPTSNPPPTEPTEADFHAGPMALDAGQIAAMRETWVSSGFDPDIFDRAARGEDPTAPTDPLAVTVAPANPSLTQAQAEEMAEILIAQGRTREEVEAALKADGYDVAPAPAPDQRSEEQREWDSVFGAGKPEDFKINYMGRIPADLTTTQLVQANAAATSWLAEVGFPPEIGPAVIERGMEVGQRYARMTEPQRDMWKREQGFVFARMAGSDERAMELRGYAAEAIRRGNPAYALMLDKTGVLYDAGVVMNLALQGERLKLRG